jgi:hypothetical protein
LALQDASGRAWRGSVYDVDRIVRVIEAGLRDAEFLGERLLKRFARPVCYQNFPQEALPVELRDENERGIWRLVNNRWSKT